MVRGEHDSGEEAAAGLTAAAERSAAAGRMSHRGFRFTCQGLPDSSSVANTMVVNMAGLQLFCGTPEGAGFTFHTATAFPYLQNRL
jgi:hypothetical protein